MNIKLLSTTFFLLLISSFNTFANGQERVFIEFTPGTAGQITGQVVAVNGEVHYRFDDLNAIVVTIPAVAITKLLRNPNIISIEPDGLRYPTAQTVPYGIDAVQARDVWDADRNGVIDGGAPIGSGRRICIIDSGINTSHEDLLGANIIGGEPSGWDSDSCGHGTHVTGSIVAVNNDLGVVGVAPGVEIYSVQVFSGSNCAWTYSSSLINAAQQCAANGANIISMSLGGGTKNRTEDRAFRNLNQAGILSIAAAGNNGGGGKSYPASYNSVISVAAIDSNNVVASFSQKNAQVELSGPGVAVLSTTGSGYASWSGTSMATPHVSAVAALIWSSDTSKTNDEIRDALTASALDLGEAGRDNSYGYGLVQAKDAWDLLGGNATSNTPPVASFSANCTDLTCSFDAGSSNDPDGSIVDYAWSYGDGNNGTGVTSAHTYAVTDSVYTVTLTVTDDAGVSSTTTQSITIGTPEIDSTGPIITDVTGTNGKGPNFTISWTTDEAATSEVVFTCCGSFTDSAFVTDHSMGFRGSKGATYEYYVRSTDADGNTSTSATYTYQN